MNEILVHSFFSELEKIAARGWVKALMNNPAELAALRKARAAGDSEAMSKLMQVSGLKEGRLASKFKAIYKALPEGQERMDYRGLWRASRRRGSRNARAGRRGLHPLSKRDL